MKLFGKKIEKEYVVAVTLMLINSVFFFFCFKNNNIWYDESYTMAIIRKPVAEICAITATDVHPPLYYLLCRGITMLTGVSQMYILRLLSWLSMMLMSVITMIKIPGIFSKKVMMYMVAMLCAMPYALAFELELRMYALGALFVYIVSLTLIELAMGKMTYINGGAILCIFSLLAAYTHYYALLAVVVLYFLYFCECIRKKKKVYFIFVCAGIDILGYLPWLGKMLTQVQTVGENYWISEITLGDVVSCFLLPLSVKKHFVPSSICAVAFLLIFIAACIGYFKTKESASRKHIRLCFEVFFIMLGICLLVSLLIQPIIQARYFSFAYVLIWLGISLSLEKIDSKKVEAGILAVFVAILLFSGIVQTGYENEKAGSDFIVTCKELEETGTQIYAGDAHAMGVYWFYNQGHEINILENADRAFYKCFEPELKAVTVKDLKKQDNLVGIKRKEKDFPSSIRKRFDCSLIKEIELENKVFEFYRMERK